MTKLIEKKLPIGKWRFTLMHEMSGHDITAVAIKGQRNRAMPIRKVSPEEFYERHPPDKDGNPTDTQVHMRGIPTMWFNKGPMIYLWPSPSQDWMVQVTLTEKVKHAEGGLRPIENTA